MKKLMDGDSSVYSKLNRQFKQEHSGCVGNLETL